MGGAERQERGRGPGDPRPVNLVLLENDEIGADGLVRLTGTRARHLRHVLAVEAGRTVRVGVVDGPMGIATVVAAEAEPVRLHCAFDAEPSPAPPVDLLLALPRPKVLQRLWAQLAALGVGRIVLTKAERVERNYFDTHVLDIATYRPLLIEGLQQARATSLPRVTVHRQFRILVEDELDRLCPDSVRFVADPGRGPSPLSAVRQHPSRRVLLAVGPEGGWNAFERSLLESHGFTAITLGPRTLRTDTACVALLAIVHEGIRNG